MRVPSLSERRADVPLLAQHFCELAQRRHGLRSLCLSSGALLALSNTDWPGNVRELSHRIEAASIRAAADDSPQVEVAHLALEGRGAEPEARSAESFHAATRAFQRKLLQDTLDAVEGNVSEAARRLDLTRGHVYTLLRTLGLERAR
ncbi:MAG: helix-turn-helix domain-containing protein [Polyangiaceae bacterium]